MLALAGVLLPTKAGQAVLAVLHYPALGGAEGNSVLAGSLRERDILFQARWEDAEAVQRPSTLHLTDAIHTGHWYGPQFPPPLRPTKQAQHGPATYQ